MLKDLYLLITATVQERNQDRRFFKPAEEGVTKTLELKIQKIDILNDVRDKLVNDITLNMPLDHLDEEFVGDFTDMVLNNKGTVNIYFNVVDNLTQNKIRLFARQYRVQMDKRFYRMLRKYKEDGKIDFQIN